MTFTVSMYDVFSYTIPGYLYLYICYYVKNVLLFSLYPIIHFTNGLVIVVMSSVGAYILRQLMESVSYFFWYKLIYKWIYKKEVQIKAFEEIAKINSVIRCNITHDHYEVYYSTIRQKDGQLLRSLEKFEAYFVMLHNVAFALLILFIVIIVRLYSSHQFLHFAVAGFTVLLSIVAFTRSIKFRLVFYKGVYLAAINYANDK